MIRFDTRYGISFPARPHNFERHRPEAVALPQRPVRKGDKVRILPARGSTKKGDQRLWLVKKVQRAATPSAVLELIETHEQQSSTVPLDNLVVVAEFRDTIYPGLVSTGKVERGGDKPFHTIINGENYHVLKALTYTHCGKVDAIYIDPPYNTGAKDWKYNNDYVEGDDLYRHSKWLAMMERRLQIARELLRADSGVLMVSIDEKEVHRLALLLEQLFPEADIQMITSVISAKGAVRVGKFSRVEEHLFIVTRGAISLDPWYRNMLDPVRDGGTDESAIEWLGLRRREPSSKRGARPNQFYPIFVDANTGQLISVGDGLADDVDRKSVSAPAGAVALWPLKPDGTEMLWGLTPEALRRNWDKGYVRINRWNAEKRSGTVQYLPGGTIAEIRNGAVKIIGRAKGGYVLGTRATDEEVVPPKRVWNVSSHNAEIGGTNLLTSLLPGRHFPYPKSLYAVEDLLRFFVAKVPKAIVLDFFAGSGTTAHAVLRLNKQDGGRRQCISVTNNEVAAAEQQALRDRNLRPGDRDWEVHGICDFITKARLGAAITGRTPDGDLIDGDYKYTDEFPMAEGFQENAEFFTLTYETPVAVSNNVAFARVAPLLWMRAGSVGRCIRNIPLSGWDVSNAYGLLVDLDRASAFSRALSKESSVRIAYIVTDDERRFQAVARRLPSGAEAIRLYESYLTNFGFASGE